ncbi:hypothetical protein F5Y06DRAFT_299979 [Hypoxylon sp. FL0890]|nr:hypothetical protein F5Y06DRAFT_299979 [Hypoxylon sp. FL0890]
MPTVRRLGTRRSPPEVQVLKKQYGYASDIWSLAFTIYFVRAKKGLLAHFDSKRLVLTWLAWAFGPFPNEIQRQVKSFLGSEVDEVVEVDSENETEDLNAWLMGESGKSRGESTLHEQFACRKIGGAGTCFEHGARCKMTNFGAGVSAD